MVGYLKHLPETKEAALTLLKLGYIVPQISVRLNISRFTIYKWKSGRNLQKMYLIHERGKRSLVGKKIQRHEYSNRTAQGRRAKRRGKP